MKSIKIGSKLESSAIALGCMRMANLDEKKLMQLWILHFKMV